MRSLTQYDKIRIFEKFLELFNAKDNFLNDRTKKGEGFYKDYLLSLNAFDYILECIVWDESSQGRDYWSDLSQAWNTYYKEAIK